MIIFLYGSDPYRLKQAGEDVVNRYKAKFSSGVNSFVFNFSDNIDDAGLTNAIKSSSFFNEHKLVVCKNCFSRKAVADTLAQMIQAHSLGSEKDITLLMIECLTEKDLRSKNKELFNLLIEKPNTIKKIDLLDDPELFEWVKNEFEARGCSINSKALDKLINMTGNDSWSLVNEIEKLVAYKNRGVIGEADISLLVAPKTDLSIFDLIDSISSKNRRRGIELLYRELKSGRDPYYILTMVIYQFRNLLMVGGLLGEGHSQAEISKKSGIHPFVVRKMSACLNLFRADELLSIYRKLLSADTDFKDGRSNITDSLYRLV